MKTALIAYAGTALVFFGLDCLWLSRLAPAFYQSRLGDLLAARPNMAAAGLFYLIYIVGMLYFAVLPALEQGSWPQAVISGAILGLIAYGTYDITNLATIRGWPLTVSIVDLIWGTCLTAAASLGGFVIASRFAG